MTYMPITRVGLAWLCCITFIKCWMVTYLFHLAAFHLVSIGFIHLFFATDFEWSTPFNLGCNLVESSSFISKCNDDILVVHFLINYVFSPPTSPLFAICGSIVKLSTHNVCFFICCLYEHSWIIYTYCALCFGLQFPLCLLSMILRECCQIVYTKWAPLCLLLPIAESNHLHKLCTMLAKNNIFMLVQISTLEEVGCWNFWIEGCELYII